MENFLEDAAIAYGYHYSEGEYLNMQWDNGQRYEYLEGKLVAMAGATLNHNGLVGNFNRALNGAKKLNGKGCDSFFLDVLLGIKNRKTYFLPDLVLTCDENDFKGDRIIFNPTLIVEVLSESTELYDRTKKWEMYRRIPSLRYYIMVSQKEYHVDMYQRPNEQSLFYFQSFDSAEAIISLKELVLEICIADLYTGIHFD